MRPHLKILLTIFFWEHMLLTTIITFYLYSLCADLWVTTTRRTMTDLALCYCCYYVRTYTFERILMSAWPSIRLSILLSSCLPCFCFRWIEYIFYFFVLFFRSFIWMSIFGQLFALFCLASMVSSPNTKQSSNKTTLLHF